MQNEKIFRLVFLVIAFILYSALVFSGLFEVQSTFLTSYIFAIIAFVYVLSMWIMERDNFCYLFGSRKKFTPKALGILYLCVAFLQSLLAGIFPQFSMVGLIVINLVILSLVIGFTVAIFQKTEKEKAAETPVIPQSDGKLLQQMRSEINIIADAQESQEIKRRLQRIAERLRIAKLYSTEEIDAIDQTMAKEIENYKTAQDVMALINALDAALDERKRLEQKIWG